MAGRGTTWSVGLLTLFLLFALRSVGGAEERYAVKPGDSLYKIAKTHGVSIDALKTANHLEKDNLRLKQALVIPSLKEKRKGETSRKPSVDPVSYVVKKGDSLHSISKKMGLSIEEIKRVNQLQTNSLVVGQTILLSNSKIIAEEDPDEELGDDEETPEAGLEERQEEKQALSPGPRAASPDSAPVTGGTPRTAS